MFLAVDLFSGIGGLTLGLKEAGFKVCASIEIDKNAVKGYKLNHPEIIVFEDDIRNVDSAEIKTLLNGQQLHLLAGCPPCQGFSSLRRLNRKQNVRDERNNLVRQYLRFVKELMPLTIMMENVPGILNYYIFKDVVKEFKNLGYNIAIEILDAKDFGVPQRRRRMVLLGSLIGKIQIEKPNLPRFTVRDAIASLPKVEKTNDIFHKIFPDHIPRIKEMIRLIPNDGGSRSELPDNFILKCHKKENVGFDDVYGRLKWDDYSSTITGGCLNPSKGRFLHPVEDRCISAREASLLQSFPLDYKFPKDISKASLALLIGNALPPKFCFYHSGNIQNHLLHYLD